MGSERAVFASGEFRGEFISVGGRQMNVEPLQSRVAGVVDVPVDELRKPRIADAGVFRDGEPVALAPDQQATDGDVDVVSHAARIAKHCYFDKQPIATGLRDYPMMSTSTREVLHDLSINSVLAENLDFYMKVRDLTQQQLADKSGISQRSVSNYLNPENRRPSATGKEPSAKLAEVELLCKALEIQPWQLLRHFKANERPFYEKIEQAYQDLIRKDEDEK